MISKIFSGHSFNHACRYVCQDDHRAVVLETEGVRGHDYRLMADDFNRQHQMRPSKKQACFHGILSFHPWEDPGDEKIVAIAKQYLERIGITHTQYAITKHTDRDHLHLHILANMINNNGKAISDSYIGLRGKKIAQQLTQEHQLIPVHEKNLALTHLENLNEKEANRYKIYIAISDILPTCTTMVELEVQLLQQGIETQYKYKGQTQEKQGVSFKIGAFCYKGSVVDRKFSLGNLQKTIASQEKLSQERKEPVTQKASSGSHKKVPSSQQSTGKGIASMVDKEKTKIWDELSSPEKSEADYMPYELTAEQKRKKKKQQKIR